MAPDRLRVEVVYAGRVQGVGFRATTAQVARAHRVAGWVRNEADGTVRCVVEGEFDEVERFLEAVESAMRGMIHDRRRHTAPAEGTLTGFEIRR